MADRAVRWAALAGRWRLRGASATFLSGDDPQAQTGLAVSNLMFREGRLTARLTLPTPTDQARLVIGLDPERENQYSIGIGGPRFAYWLDSYAWSGRGPTPIASWGPPETLQAGAHAVTINVKGQSLDFAVDDVPIFATQLPSPMAGEQVGALAAGGSGIRFEHVEADRASPEVFVVMHFASPFNELYSEVIVPVCRSLGLSPRRADEFQYPGVILHDIVTGIVGATVVIAEITPENPNVYYELGYAHAIGKPTILLARKETEPPFDISGYRVVFYDDSIAGKPVIERELRAHLQNILGIPQTPAR